MAEKITFAEVEKPQSYINLRSFSLKSGKKYICMLVILKILVIWLIYNRSNEFWSDFQFPLQAKSHFINYSGKNLNKVNIDNGIFHIPLNSEEDLLQFYVKISPEQYCFIKGLNLKDTKKYKKCRCLSDWFGHDCGIPATVWYSNMDKTGIKIQRRKKPRRIIYSVLFMKEFTLLDLIVRDAFPVVDVFVIAEALIKNSSTLVQHQKNGFLLEFQDKFVSLQIENDNKNFSNMQEWSLFMYTKLWKEAYEYITDFRPDDLFILLHVSSIISKDVLLFLKLYEGYPEPFYFELRHVLYQFHRTLETNFTNLQNLFPPLGCTFQYFHFICNSNIQKLYSNTCISNNGVKIEFEKHYGHVGNWLIDSIKIPSGWQCNWCANIHEIKHSFDSYKWLSVALRLNNSLVLNDTINAGRWFDGSLIKTNLVAHNNPYFAPESILSDPQRYLTLING